MYNFERFRSDIIIFQMLLKYIIVISFFSEFYQKEYTHAHTNQNQM